MRTIHVWILSAAIGISPTGSAAAAHQPYDAVNAFSQRHSAYVGLYRCEDEFFVVGQYPSAEIIYFQRIKTGDMRFMTPETTAHSFRYSRTRNGEGDVAGTVTFRDVSGTPARNLIWTDGSDRNCVAERFDAGPTPVRFSGETDDVSLSGYLVRPRSKEPVPAVVLAAQSDRFDVWDVGMWMLSRGVAVLAYDRRNARPGASTGPAIEGRYQDRQAAHAEDLKAAVAYLRSREDVDADRIGVAGWSGGGFTAAFVAAADPNLGFFVNIAGDASPGFEQASHLFVSRLLREGFSDEDVATARVFVDTHFGVAKGHVSWRDYQSEIERVSKTSWYRFLSDRYSIPFARPDDVTDIGDHQAQWGPDRVYGKIEKTPTLGVFFEYDQSSAPSSPRHFSRVLHAAGNRNYSVVTIPDANHGGWVLNGAGYRYDTGVFTGRSPILIDQVADWVERQVTSP